MFTVQVCVNHSCNIGPYLDRERVQAMPNAFGPRIVNRVLRDCVQSLVDAASDRTAIYGMLRQGQGKVYIHGMYTLKFIFNYCGYCYCF